MEVYTDSPKARRRGQSVENSDGGIQPQTSTMQNARNTTQRRTMTRVNLLKRELRERNKELKQLKALVEKWEKHGSNCPLLKEKPLDSYASSEDESNASGANSPIGSPAPARRRTPRKSRRKSTSGARNFLSQSGTLKLRGGGAGLAAIPEHGRAVIPSGEARSRPTMTITEDVSSKKNSLRKRRYSITGDPKGSGDERVDDDEYNSGAQLGSSLQRGGGSVGPSPRRGLNASPSPRFLPSFSNLTSSPRQVQTLYGSPPRFVGSQNKRSSGSPRINSRSPRPGSSHGSPRSELRARV